MTKKRNITAPEAIGAWLGWDSREIREALYKPTRYTNPSVYCVGEDFACCPAGNRKPPTLDRDGFDSGFVWKPVFQWGGRTVYCSTIEDMAEANPDTDTDTLNEIREKKALRERGVIISDAMFDAGYVVRKAPDGDRIKTKTIADAIAKGWELAGGKPQ